MAMCFKSKTVGMKALSLMSLIGLMALFAASCSTSNDPNDANEVAAYDAEVATEWFDLMRALVQGTGGYTPPVAARAFGYAGITLYESVVGGMPEYNSLAGQLNGFGSLPVPSSGKEYEWRLVANSALAYMVAGFFPTAPDSLKNRISTLEITLNQRYSANAQSDVITRSQEFGRTLATAIFRWSTMDGGHEGYLRNFPTDYVPPTGPGMWVTTPSAYQRAMQPYWGSNRPFVLSYVNPTADCDPGPHPAFSTDPGSPFYREAAEVYNTVRNLSTDRRDIALFWADNPGQTATPSGHSISILTQLIQQQDASLDFAAEAYAKVGIAVNDAFIACWKLKYVYNLIRPISYIQLYIDTNWNKPALTDPVSTPPFPEYPSGHSVQGGASFTVLKELFGNIAFVDHTHDNRGMSPRSYSSMDNALQENALSRLYGGIHYRAAIDKGVIMGEDIGRIVSGLKFKD